jgi:hypothetical protein
MAGAIDDVMLFTESQHQREVSAMALQHRKYDGDLQMFVDPPREPDMARLTFLRWLVERRRLEHGPAGVPCGDFTLRPGLSGESTGDRKAA